MNIEEAKDQIAKQKGYSDWSDMYGKCPPEMGGPYEIDAYKLVISSKDTELEQAKREMQESLKLYENQNQTILKQSKEMEELKKRNEEIITAAQRQNDLHVERRNEQRAEVEELKKERDELNEKLINVNGRIRTYWGPECDRLKGEIKLWKIKFFIGKKIKVGTEQNSRKIQEMLLDLDFEWTYTDGKSEKTVQFTDAKYLFFEGSEVLPQLRKTISCSSNDQVFKSQYQKEIFLRDFRLT